VALALMVAVLLLAAGAVLVLWRRRTADPYGYSGESVYPYGWSAGDWTTPDAESPSQPEPEPEPAAVAAPAEPVAAATPRRRDRAAQAIGGMAAAGAAVSLLLGRLTGRRGRRR
jgi:hypothetical protein